MKLITRCPEGENEQGEMMARVRSIAPDKLKDSKEELLFRVVSAMFANERGILLRNELNEEKQVKILTETLLAHVFTAKDVGSIITALRRQDLPTAKDFILSPYTITLRCLIEIWSNLSENEIDHRYGKEGAPIICHLREPEEARTQQRQLAEDDNFEALSWIENK